MRIAKRRENEGKTIVTVLPDSGERYLSSPCSKAHSTADGTRLFVYADQARIEALDPRTGARLYAVDVDAPDIVTGLSFTADGNLAGIIEHPCNDETDCAPTFAAWSPADLTLLAERPGRPKTYATAVANVRGFGAAFACSRWNGLCALGLRDISVTQPGSYVVSLTLTDGMPVRAVPSAANLMAFAPDGNHLAILTFTENGGPAPIQVFRVDDGTLVASLSFDLNVP